MSFIIAVAGGSALLARPSYVVDAKEPLVGAAPTAAPPLEVVDLFGSAPRVSSSGIAGTAEIALTVSRGDTLQTLLERAGIAHSEAARAHKLLDAELPDGIPEQSEVAILLGAKGGKGSNSLERLTLLTPSKIELSVERLPSGALRLAKSEIAGGTKAEHYTGDIGGSFYWSLRQAGVPAEASDEFVRAVSSKRHSGRFEAVVAWGRRANGAPATPVLLYAAVQGSGEAPFRRVKWVVGGETRWVDPSGSDPAADTMVAPVSGRITSHFGGRAHPILRFFRFHRGVDIAAPRGTPIVAAADGKVTASGWNGGHGQQVRVVHANGLETSYSHMSATAAVPGSSVRRGQVIGYVGSTGLSTGPHLHYEVRRGGELLDPLSAGHMRRAGLSEKQLGAVRRHLQQLLAIAAPRRA